MTSTLDPRVAVVTGAAGGIGLELCKQLERRGDTVFACPRREGNPDLAALADAAPGRVHVLPTDVADDDSVERTAARIAETAGHVDLLINNAGVYPEKRGPLEGLDLADCAFAFEVNSLGPLRVTRALLPLLRRGSGKRLVQITSLMGSMADNGSGGSYAYRMSKAALNMANVNLGHEFGREGFVALTVHPGWVQTRMGGGAAPLTAEESVAGILRLAAEAGADRNGGFFRWDGRPLPF